MGVAKSQEEEMMMPLSKIELYPGLIRAEFLPRLTAEPVSSWPHLDFEAERLYWTPIGEQRGEGFVFGLVGWVQGSASWEGHPFDDPDGHFEIMLRGFALSDGIHVIEFSPEDAHRVGALFRPNTGLLRAVFSELRNLEEKHCSSPEKWSR